MKTEAEQFLSKSTYGRIPIDERAYHHKDVVNLLSDFAAHSVREYKEKLKGEIGARFKEHMAITPVKDLIEIIESTPLISSNMTKTENEIIAEFMDFELIDGKDKYMARWIKQTDGLLDPYAGPHRAEHLRFNTSWDWLMPVVEKIAKMHSEKFHYDPVEIAKGVFPEDNNYMDVICLPVSTPISQVHKAVVDFIKTLTP